MSNEAFFIAAQSGVVPLAYGEPGVAKTRTTEAFAQVLGKHYECVVGSHHDPSELTGFPSLNTDENGRRMLSFVPTEWRIALESAQNGGLLHLDEMTDSSPATQAACLQLLTHGVKNTWIVATANPTECGTNAFDLSPATVNRLCVLNWETPVKSWHEGMIAGFDKIHHNFPILPANWTALIGSTNSLIVSFVTKVMPTVLQALPKTDDLRGKPWPSIRSWTNAARVLAAANSVGAREETINTLISGCIGEGAAMAFNNWRTKLDLPDPETLLADPKLYDPPARGDLAHAALSAVVAAVVRNNSKERWDAAWQVIDIQCDRAPDIAATVASPLIQNKLEKDWAPPKSVQQKLLPLLKALST